MEGLKYDIILFCILFCHSRVEHGLSMLLEVHGALRLLRNWLEDLY